MNKCEEQLDEMLAFSRAHPWPPQQPEAMLRRFLTDFISSRNLIFDLHDSRGRLATAVLLDQVKNPANDACLEILGLRSDAHRSAVVAQIIDWAKSAVPKHRSGFQVGLTADLVTAGLVHYYDTYVLERTDFAGIDAGVSAKITEANLADRDQVYDVLCRSFAHNPDTCIPEAELWKSGFLQAPKTWVYLWRDGGELLGFATLAETDAGDGTEVRTLGVLPEVRGQGIGAGLLRRCLVESVRFGHRRCQLTVGVSNRSALGLYLRTGFRVTQTHQCYRMGLS